MKTEKIIVNEEVVMREILCSVNTIERTIGAEVNRIIDKLEWNNFSQESAWITQRIYGLLADMYEKQYK